MRTILLKLRRSKLLIVILRLLFQLASKLPVQKKTIVFESFLGKQYSDNPKALYEYIKENYPTYTLVWSYDRKYSHNFNGQGLNCVPRLSLKWIILMARSKYWIVNSRLPLWIPKPKHTVYIQTWHGTPLKKLGLDMKEVHMANTDTTSYKKEFLTEANKWDYLISPNAYSTEIFKRAFGFNKTVIESGYPRNDILYKKNTDENIANLKKQLNLPLDKKIILYAPTWRDNEYQEIGQYKLNIKLDFQKFKQELGEDYIVLLRMHYLVAQNIDIEEYKDFIYDFSAHNDISELYLVSDMLITDYSSVFFDYANLNRPILFFVYDIETYRDTLRGFYFNIEDNAPGPLVYTNDQLISCIKQIDEKNVDLIHANYNFHEKFCYLEDGNASKRVVQTIFK